MSQTKFLLLGGPLDQHYVIHESRAREYLVAERAESKCFGLEVAPNTFRLDHGPRITRYIRTSERTMTHESEAI